MILRALVQIFEPGMAVPLRWPGGFMPRAQHPPRLQAFSLVFEAKAMKGELVFADAAEQFDAGDRRGRAIMVLEAEHGDLVPGLPDPSVVLLNQIVQVFR